MIKRIVSFALYQPLFIVLGTIFIGVATPTEGGAMGAAGALILYPRYLDPVTELPCPPEILLQRFAEGWRPKASWLIRVRRWQGRLAKMFGTTSR